jgi:hypothetical protein
MSVPNAQMISLAITALPVLAAPAALNDHELEHAQIEKSIAFFIVSNDLGVDIP